MMNFKVAIAWIFIGYVMAYGSSGCEAGEPPVGKITIDGAHVLRMLPVNPTGFCMSFLSDADKPSQPSLADVIAPMHIGSLRYPMGTLAENYLFHDLTKGIPKPGKLSPRVINRSKSPGNSSSWDWAVNPDGSYTDAILGFDAFITLCRKTGAEPIVLVATHGHLFPKSLIDEQALFRNAEEWVRYANITCKYGVRYWEIGNEVDLKEPTSVMSREQYLRTYREMATRMKKIDPTIHTGLGISHSVDYCEAALRQFPELVDFIVAHQYGQKVKDYDSYQQGKGPTIHNIQMVLKAIDDNAPAARRASTEVLVTEYSSYSGSVPKTAERRENNIFNAMCSFEMLADMVSVDPRVRFTHFWVTHNPWGDPSKNSLTNANAFTMDNRVLPQGRAVEIMGRFIGDRMLSVQTSGPGLRGWASASSSGDITVWLLNRRPTEVSTEFVLKNLPQVTALKGWALRGSSPGDKQPSWGSVDGLQLSQGSGMVKVPPLCVLALHSLHDRN